MEGFKIKVKNHQQRELDFEDEKDFSKSIKTIRYEYRHKGVKFSIPLLFIMCAFIIYLISAYQNLLDPIGFSALLQRLSSSEILYQSYPKPSYLTIFWVPFSFGVYCTVYFIKLILQKFTSSLKSFFKQELDNLDLKICRNLRSVLMFIVLNMVSITILLLIDLKFIVLSNNSLSKTFVGFFIAYLSISIVLPVIWGIFFDKYMVKIKGKYTIFLNLHYKVRKVKIQQTNQLGIYMKSNRIAYKMNKGKNELFIKISENRWLPRIRRIKLFIFRIGPYIRFHEYSTPINFQKQFLNIVLALKEWDLKTTPI